MFLRINNNEIGFVVEGIHEILDTDVKITDEDYNTFFELQNQGKKFKPKETSSGNGLFDYVEEVVEEVNQIPVVIPKSDVQTLKEQSQELQTQVDTLSLQILNLMEV